jgi:hypothetical protein
MSEVSMFLSSVWPLLRENVGLPEQKKMWPTAFHMRKFGVTKKALIIIQYVYDIKYAAR